MIAFLKRNKEYGGYRDDGKNVSLGYLGCSISEVYFRFVGIDKIEVGDSVLYNDNSETVICESHSDIQKYIAQRVVRLFTLTGVIDFQKSYEKLSTSPELLASADNPDNDTIRYLMTKERLHQILNGIEDWKTWKSEEDVETIEEQLGELNKYILPKVDFETENLYFAYC